MARINGAVTAPAPVTTPATRDHAPTVESGSDERVNLGEQILEARTALPRHDPDAPFLLCYHPAKWIVIGGHCVPFLRKFMLIKGLDGVVEASPGNMRWRDTSGRWMDRGYTVIPHNDGPKGDTYLRRDRVLGGFAHRTCFETFHPGESTITSDFNGYAKWINELFDKGSLPRPAMHALVSLAEKLREQHLVASDLATHQPSAAVRAKRILADLEAVEATIAKWRVSIPSVESESIDLGSGD